MHVKDRKKGDDARCRTPDEPVFVNTINGHNRAIRRSVDKLIVLRIGARWVAEKEEQHGRDKPEQLAQPGQEPAQDESGDEGPADIGQALFERAQGRHIRLNALKQFPRRWRGLLFCYFPAHGSSSLSQSSSQSSSGSSSSSS